MEGKEAEKKTKRERGETQLDKELPERKAKPKIKRKRIIDTKWSIGHKDSFCFIWGGVRGGGNKFRDIECPVGRGHIEKNAYVIERVNRWQAIRCQKCWFPPRR